MRDAHTCIQLRLRGADFADYRNLFDEGLIYIDIEENCGAPPVLCKNDGTPSSLHLFEDGRGVRPEFSDGLTST